MMDRRNILGLAAALAAGPAALTQIARPARAAETLAKAMPVMAKHAGSWEGMFRWLKPNGELLREYEFRNTIILTGGTPPYRQENWYRENGEERTSFFEAELREGRLVMLGDRLSGEVWEIDDQTIAALVTSPTVAGLMQYEFVTIAQDGSTRGRVGMAFNGGELDRVLLVEEKRVS